jgi:hypothetical protein
MTLDLTDDQQQALAAYLRRALDADKYPLAPSLDPIKEVMAMLRPAPPAPQPKAQQRSPAPPSRGRYAKRR